MKFLVFYLFLTYRPRLRSNDKTYNSRLTFEKRGKRKCEEIILCWSYRQATLNSKSNIVSFYKIDKKWNSSVHLYDALGNYIWPTQ